MQCTAAKVGVTMLMQDQIIAKGMVIMSMSC